MNILQMQMMFHDVLESTNVIFATTSERPTSSVVLNYLNEAQNTFFNQRYLIGDTLQNIMVAKSLKTELSKMLITKKFCLDDNDSMYAQTSKIKGLITGEPGEYVISSWNKFEYYVEGFVRVNREHVLPTPSESKGDYVELLPVNAVNLNKYLTNFMNVPILPQPVIVMDEGVTGSAAMVIRDIYTTLRNLDDSDIDGGGNDIANRAKLKLVLLGRPAPLTLSVEKYDQECDIDVRFHENIVRLAVETFLSDKTKMMPKEQDSPSDRDTQ